MYTLHLLHDIRQVRTGSTELRIFRDFKLFLTNSATTHPIVHLFRHDLLYRGGPLLAALTGQRLQYPGLLESAFRRLTRGMPVFPTGSSSISSTTATTAPAPLPVPVDLVPLPLAETSPLAVAPSSSAAS